MSRIHKDYYDLKRDIKLILEWFSFISLSFAFISLFSAILLPNFLCVISTILYFIFGAILTGLAESFFPAEVATWCTTKVERKRRKKTEKWEKEHMKFIEACNKVFRPLNRELWKI